MQTTSIDRYVLVALFKKKNNLDNNKHKKNKDGWQELVNRNRQKIIVFFFQFKTERRLQFAPATWRTLSWRVRVRQAPPIHYQNQLLFLSLLNIIMLRIFITLFPYCRHFWLLRATFSMSFGRAIGKTWRQTCWKWSQAMQIRYVRSHACASLLK